MKKKGFTLIELLAVIVILAILMVVAVPKILDVIENSRQSAVKSSTELYIDAVEYYQTMQSIKNKKILPEGTYNVATESEVNGNKYKSLNDLISVKGKKPTGGTIGISKNSKVSTAYMCMNDYVVEYANRKVNILDNDCGDMSLIINFSTDSENWETQKTLTITYPEGDYEYYFNLESGSATYNDEEITIGEDVKVEKNLIQLVLKENSKVSAWIIKNGNKKSLRTYEETKIGDGELGELSAVLETKYPILTINGMKMLPKLTITYQEQEGVTAQYSVDDGSNWLEYTGQVIINSSNVKAKLVRNNGEEESAIIDATISNITPTDALPEILYDLNDTTYLQTSDHYYFEVDSAMWNQYLKVVLKNGNTSRITTFKFYDTNGEVLKTETFNDADAKTLKILIPENTTKIERYGSDNYCIIYEIGVYNQPTINVTQYYPKLSLTGNTDGYNIVTIDYFTSSLNKFYSINNGEWQEYQNSQIKLDPTQSIKAMGKDVNQVMSDIAIYDSSSNNSLPKEAYDGNESNEFKSAKTYYFEIDSSSWNKYLKIIIRHGNTARHTTYNFYSSTGELLKTVSYNPAALTTIYEQIPVNTVKIERTATDSNCIIREISISETNQ